MTLALIAPAPPLESLIPLVTDACNSPATKRTYGSALARFFAWLPPGSTFDRATVQRYRAHLLDAGAGSSTVNLAISAIKRLAAEAAACGLLRDATPIQAIEGVPRRGVRAGRWLTRDRAQALLNAPDGATLMGTRDRAILALMLGAGLRRDEVARLEVRHFRQIADRWCIADLEGKGRRVRTVPLAPWCAQSVRSWLDRAELREGSVFRVLGQRGAITGPLGERSLWNVVARYAKLAGVEVAPHDLRRSFAQLSRRGGADIEQIQKVLGHSSVSVTQNYLGTALDLDDSPSDRVGLSLSRSAS